MGYRNLITTACMFVLGALQPSPLAAEQERTLPDEGYGLIGEYRTEQILKVRAGKAVPRLSSGLTYKVYSNGAKLRLVTSHTEGYQTFDIYRSDGIATGSPQSTQVVPGLQAKNTAGKTLKQLSLTKQYLTITSFPPLSDEVIITRAKAVIPKARPVEE